MTGIPEYRIWDGIKQRVFNKNKDSYKYYGGRGITMCERWKRFENFYKDMGEKPTPLHTIDRIDNSGNYCKNNCRWATRAVQSNNSRNCHFIKYKGEIRSIKAWADFLGINDRTLRNRIRRGWKTFDAFNRQVNN